MGEQTALHPLAPRAIDEIFLFALIKGTALIFCIIFFLAGCFGKTDDGSGYWTRGCILPDESMMAAVGSDAALIDLSSGKTVRKISGFFSDVVCLSDSRILALTQKEAIELNTQKRINRMTGWNVVGPVYGNQILVSFRQLTGSRTMQSWNGPLKLSVESFDLSQTPKEILLTTDHFPSLGTGRENFLEAIPVRVLMDNRLLVAAGFSSTDRKPEKPWRLFTVDLTNGAVSPFGGQRTGDDDLSMFVKLSRFAATPDGSFVAGASGKTIVLMTYDRFDVVARLKLENAREIQLLRFNQEGTLLAVAVTDLNGRQGRIHVLDGRSGKQLWHTDYQNGVIYFMEFLRDNSIVLMRSNQILSRLDGKDGLIRY